MAGFARCGACGGALGVRSRDHGKQRAYFYGCLVYAKRGPAVCQNRVLIPLERVDAAVLSRIADHALRPAVVNAIVAGVLEALEPEKQATQAETLPPRTARRRTRAWATDRGDCNHRPTVGAAHGRAATSGTTGRVGAGSLGCGVEPRARRSATD